MAAVLSSGSAAHPHAQTPGLTTSCTPSQVCIHDMRVCSAITSASLSAPVDGLPVSILISIVVQVYLSSNELTAAYETPSVHGVSTCCLPLCNTTYTMLHSTYQLYTCSLFRVQRF